MGKMLNLLDYSLLFLALVDYILLFTAITFAALLNVVIFFDVMVSGGMPLWLKRCVKKLDPYGVVR